MYRPPPATHRTGSGQGMLLVGYMVPASPGCTRLVRATFAERQSSPGLAGLLQRAVPRWLAHLSLHVGLLPWLGQAALVVVCPAVPLPALRIPARHSHHLLYD